MQWALASVKNRRPNQSECIGQGHRVALLSCSMQKRMSSRDLKSDMWSDRPSLKLAAASSLAAPGVSVLKKCPQSTGGSIVWLPFTPRSLHHPSPPTWTGPQVPRFPMAPGKPRAILGQGLSISHPSPQPIPSPDSMQRGPAAHVACMALGCLCPLQAPIVSGLLRGISLTTQLVCHTTHHLPLSSPWRMAAGPHPGICFCSSKLKRALMVGVSFIQKSACDYVSLLPPVLLFVFQALTRVIGNSLTILPSPSSLFFSGPDGALCK